MAHLKGVEIMVIEIGIFEVRWASADTECEIVAVRENFSDKAIIVSF